MDAAMIPAGFVLDPPSAGGALPVVEAPQGAALPEGFVVDPPPTGAVSAPASSYDAADSIINAASFGALPNVKAAGAATGDAIANALGAGNGKSWGQNYDSALSEAQAARRDFSSQHPYQDAVSGLAGGLATGGGMVKSGASLLGRALAADSSIPVKLAAGAVDGGALGGAYGFGNGEGGFDRRLDDSLSSAGLGAALGALGVPAASLVKKGAALTGNAISGLRNDGSQAERLLVQAIMRDRQTPEGIADAVRAAQSAGTPDYAMVDAAGKNTQRLGAVAAKTPSAFRDTVARDMAARQEGQGDRIKGAITDLLGDGSGVYQTEQQLVDAMRQRAAPLYEAAYGVPTPTAAPYLSLLQKQSIQDAIGAAQRVAAEQQRPITDLFTTVPNPKPSYRQVETGLVGPDGQALTQAEAVNPTLTVPTTRGWDYIKRELDSRVNQLYKTGDTTAATAIKETRNALRDQMAADNPAYAQALSTYADDRSALEAIDAGRNLIKAANPDATAAEIGGLTPERASLARQGAARELGARLDNMGVGRDKTLPFSAPSMQAKLAAVSGDPVAQAAFNDRLGREGDMLRASRQMLGGSSTAENLNDMADTNAGVVAAAAASRWITAAARALDPLVQRIMGMNEAAADRTGAYLLNRDPEAIAALQGVYDKTVAASKRPNSTPLVSGVLADSQNVTR